jgi:CheY-like chemotaxis protein
MMSIHASKNKDSFQALLANMRAEFLDEFPERCGHLEDLVLSLEKSPANQDTFNELYRKVHSLKGSGGTHGLSIVTTVCHQLETRLTDAAAKQDFGKAFVTVALAYVDMLRKIQRQALLEAQDFSEIEAELEALRKTTLQSRKAGLIAESSATMAGFYQHTLAALPVQLTVVNDGLTALERLLREPFDFVIVGRELKELNGIALMAALRASTTKNQKIPALLLTSRKDSIPVHARFSAVIARDTKQADNLIAEVKRVLSI